LDILKKDQTIVIRNGKVNLFKQCMRLSVDDVFGAIQELPHAQKLVTCTLEEPKTVKMENNFSLQKYEIIYEYQ
jgi:predicted NACHT family NTPase